MSEIGSLRQRTHRLGAAALILLSGTACDYLGKLLEVEAPSQVIAESLTDPAVAPMMVRGAEADFECALARYIVGAGLLGQEFADAQTAGIYWDYDRRTVVPERGPHGTTSCEEGWAGIYIPLSVARFQADDVLNRLDGWTDEEVAGRSRLQAMVAALGGYSRVLLGEGMCSAALDLGPELSPTELNALAEERFTRAIQAATAAGAADLLGLARVGRARARLNQGKLAEAAEDARLVPEGFVYNATYSATTGRRYNTVFDRTHRFNSITVGEAFRNLEFAGLPDPRVPVVNTGEPGNDRITIMWLQNKYTDLGAPIPIATWEEAQLIVAEAAGGQEAVDIINTLHARVGLPLFHSSDPQEIRAQIIQERARELFLEGHHLGDRSRYNLPLIPPPGAPYPPKAGGTYGDATCFPLPDKERKNNPNILP
jgi:starch-binding outer membrane protein, SusD/RagB family